MKLQGRWSLLVALALVGCEGREAAEPAVERRTPSALEQVDQLLSGVEDGRLAPAVPAEPGVEEPEAVEPEVLEIPVAKPVPDKPGFVVSPFTGKWLDVTGLPAGEVVADPEFSAEEKKYFRVPEFPPLPPTDPAPVEEGETTEAATLAGPR